MSAPAQSFAGLRAAAACELIATVPMLADWRRHKSVIAMATVIALSEAKLGARPIDERLAADLRVTPTPDRDQLALSLIREIHAAIEAPVLTANRYRSFDAGDFVEQNHFLDLVQKLSRAGAREDVFDALIARIGPAIKCLSERVNALARDHLQAIVRRDLSFVPQPCLALNPTMVWALAPDLQNHADRATILVRRRQALELYGALHLVLREPAITDIIDAGAPLIPALTSRLGISVAHLRRLHHARALSQSLTAHRDCAAAIGELKAHAIPIAEWPEGKGWETTPWTAAHDSALIRPDYIDGSTEVRDALTAFRQDILQPVAAERAKQLKVDSLSPIGRFLHSFAVPVELSGSNERQCFLSGVANALLGSRQARSFREAVTQWHRRAACAAALRHEQAANRPGWPPCCKPWRSADGRFEIVPLASAQDLVDEGNALSHCVGGYYDACRSGSTQILSLREAGERAATIELVVNDCNRSLHIEVGQFKARCNGRPERRHFDALRLFIADLKRGSHSIDQAALIRHRREMRQSGDYVWHRGPLPMSHAERAWPLYRALVPRGAPQSLREWIEETGLGESIDPMLRAIAGHIEGTRDESL